MNAPLEAPLGIGIIGSGFIAHFHVRSWQSIRGSDIVATQSRSLDRARELASYAEELRVGKEVTAYDDIAALVRDERVDAVWVLTPNHTRVEVVRAVCEEVRSGRASLRGIAVEKPLGRNLAEAREVADLVRGAGLRHAYLENQVYAPRLTRTRELMWARGAEPFRARPTSPRCTEGALGPALGVVLGQRGAGRRRPQRPHVPLPRSRPLPAHAARTRPLRVADPGLGDRHHRLAALGPRTVRRPPRRDPPRRAGLPHDPLRGLRERDVHLRQRRRRARHRRGDDLLGLRRRRHAALLRTPRPRVLDERQLPLRRRDGLLLPRPGAAGGRGPAGEAERGAGPHARDRRRARRLRLRRREHPHHARLRRRRPARRIARQRGRGHRTPHGRLLRGRDRHRRPLPRGPLRLRARRRPQGVAPAHRARREGGDRV
ncbi:LOW QUALITY PROTEIN: oxidoreductase domain-containing protein, partial [Streptomyces sp. SPB78]